MKKVLIVVDDTLRSKAVLEPLYKLMKSPEKIILLYVERVLGRSLMMDMLGEAEIQTLREELRDTEYKKELDRKAEKVLAHYKKELQLNGYACDIDTIIKDGIPSEEILKTADEEGVELLILGHYSNKGLNRVITGNVAKTVQEKAKIPVLVANSSSGSEGTYNQNYAYIFTLAIVVAVFGTFIIFSELLFSLENILTATVAALAVTLVLGIIIKKMGALSVSVLIKEQGEVKR